MKARISATRRGPRYEVRALELEQQTVEAEREQDERDVRVGQQVDECLERVHPEVDERDAVQLEGHRLAIDLDGLPIGLGADVLERRGDAVDGTDLDRLTAGDDFALSTVHTAQSTFRPRVSAIERMLAIASFLTFSPIVPARSSPPDPTGDAAPMFVPGAM